MDKFSKENLLKRQVFNCWVKQSKLRKSLKRITKNEWSLLNSYKLRYGLKKWVSRYNTTITIRRFQQKVQLRYQKRLKTLAFYSFLISIKQEKVLKRLLSQIDHRNKLKNLNCGFQALQNNAIEYKAKKLVNGILGCMKLAKLKWELKPYFDKLRIVPIRLSLFKSLVERIHQNEGRSAIKNFFNKWKNLIIYEQIVNSQTTEGPWAEKFNSHSLDLANIETFAMSRAKIDNSELFEFVENSEAEDTQIKQKYMTILKAEIDQDKESQLKRSWINALRDFITSKKVINRAFKSKINQSNSTWFSLRRYPIKIFPPLEISHCISKVEISRKVSWWTSIALNKFTSNLKSEQRLSWISFRWPLSVCCSKFSSKQKMLTCEKKYHGKSNPVYASRYSAFSNNSFLKVFVTHSADGDCRQYASSVVKSTTFGCNQIHQSYVLHLVFFKTKN